MIRTYTHKFWLNLAIGFFCINFAWLILLYAQIRLPTASSEWVYETYKLKNSIASSIKEDKIVIVSGSNGLFSIDSKIISNFYKKPTVNQSVHAGMGLPYILENSKTVLKPYDIALLPLEYPLYLYNGIPDTQLIDYIWARNPEYLWKLTAHERVRIIWGTEWERLIKGYISWRFQKYHHEIYNINKIDKITGDQLNTEKHKLTGEALEKWKHLHHIQPHKYAQADNPNNLAWQYLQNYINWANQQKICLIFLPPAFHKTPYYHENKQEKAFYLDLPKKVRALNVHYIGSPLDYMYSTEYLFDTEYHLNAEGRKLHTQRLIAALGSNLDQYCTHLGN